MTAHTSPHHVFPDFEPIISKLIEVRTALEADYDSTAKAIPNFDSKDVRLTAFAHLINNADFAALSIHFLNNYLLPLDNPWWNEPQQERLFGGYGFYDRSIAANSFNNAFSKYTIMHKLFGEIESTFRQLLRKIDPSAANNATKDISGVFGALCARIGKKPPESDELLKLLRLGRNTIHNNGVYYSETFTNDTVTYKGATYAFTHGKPIDYVNWNFLIERLDDVRRLFGAVITNPNIIGITDHIPDMFAENQTVVRVSGP